MIGNAKTTTTMTAAHDEEGVRAAEYVRMSTDGQQYSIAYQQAAIREHALSHGIKIVRTFADPARSGLSLEDRPALLQLLREVEGGRASYSVILVYDVSRWGRFQDEDESAFYEFICRRAKIEVRYCAEPFESAADLTKTIYKSIKRSMAAEFSRDLSAKVLSAACSKASRGRMPGGRPGFGLRRMVVEDRKNRQSISGHQAETGSKYTVLVLGPKQEERTVQRIFRLCAIGGLSPSSIARILNREGTKNRDGQRWGGAGVRYILQNEKYTGTLVYNRSSERLGSRRHINPVDQWIRTANALPATVSKHLFDAAQLRIKARHHRHNAASLLALLRRTREKHQKLSVKLIRSETGTDYQPVYRRYFGSLSKAYEIIGYTQRWRNRNLPREFARRQKERDILLHLIEQFSHFQYVVGYDRRARLLVANRSTIAIKLLPFAVTDTRKSPIWCQPAGAARNATITVVGRLNRAETILDYFVLPRSVVRAWIRIGGRFPNRLAKYRAANLSEVVSRLTDKIERDRSAFHRKPITERSAV